MRLCTILTCALLLAACDAGTVRVGSKPKGNSAPKANEEVEFKAPSDSVLLEQLRKDEKEIAARTERQADEIQVQHILIATHEGMDTVDRTKAEAELRAALVYAKIKAGADFDALVATYTDDSPPGIYTMRQNGQPGPGVSLRSGMVPAFGNVGWRLEVGEVGVAPYSADSPYGWHIIKRLK